MHPRTRLSKLTDTDARAQVYHQQPRRSESVKASYA